MVAKRPRTEPVDTDTRASAEQALLPAGDLLGVLQVFECFEAALRSQGTVDGLALLLQLSLVSRGALGCATRACTQLCDSRHADLLNALLPPSACVSMRTGDEDAAVQAHRFEA